ncbi:hypothetical protein Poli38472_008684 [Pythium oligandrum]|uniref:AB hydrolase-1 domain-containing protein n=1 Tax=Pythium oligandrum TaxID=41045 RepID=A0A8K1C407_PYTOL|nr:hypothetical protein Poli38472_008684 [Pythium oligandrum]|eukprot:TMW56036.1 hypothetical protein Poli38472_008684 [Pythium oligandrum]
MSERIALLLCHGGSFNKETWDPIIRRVLDSSLLEGVPVDVLMFDWSYHGSKHNLKEPGKLYYLDGDENFPRVEHACNNWPVWAPEELSAFIKEIRAEDEALDRKTRLVGIGHSMGAVSIMAVEMSSPGTFEGIVGFEPICNTDMDPEYGMILISKVVMNTLDRESEWDSWDEMVKYHSTSKAFRRWNEESKEAYLKGGIVETPDGKFRLACLPSQEAGLYCYSIMRYDVEDHARMGCKMVYAHGGSTMLFSAKLTKTIADALPDQVFLSPAIIGRTHMMVVEDPESCAERIIKAFELFPVFQS